MDTLQSSLKSKYVRGTIATLIAGMVFYMTSGMNMGNKGLIIILLYIQALVVIYFDAKIVEIKRRMKKQLLTNGKKVYKQLKQSNDSDEKIDQEGIEQIMTDMLYSEDVGDCGALVNNICVNWDKPTPKGLKDKCLYEDGACTGSTYANEMLCNRDKLATFCGTY